MAMPDLKKRQGPKVDISTTNDSTETKTKKPRTITWQETSKWQSDNKYILTGYRPEKPDYLEILASLTFLHNETCNVYTHLVGALLLPFIASTFLRCLAEPQYPNVSTMDYTMFGVYYWCAELCLVLSALYHLMQPHSHRVELFWHTMDLLGIIIVIIGTFTSGIYYLFFCEPNLQRLHWGINIKTGIFTALFITNPIFKTPRWRNAKVACFVAFGASAFIPLVHAVQRYGLAHMLQYSELKWYLLELTFYGAGVGLYAFRIPERLAPGTFDIWGSSHQLFHVAILFAMYVHATALFQGFILTHTLDVCELQNVNRPI